MSAILAFEDKFVVIVKERDDDARRDAWCPACCASLTDVLKRQALWRGLGIARWLEAEFVIRDDYHLPVFDCYAISLFFRRAFLLLG